MPLTSNKLGGNATWVLTANGTLNLTDVSVAYDGNRQGTIQLQGANAIGTNTTFTVDYSNGDFIQAVVNSTTTDVKVINQVVNASFLNITSTWSAANAATTYTKSETVLYMDVDAVKFSSNGSWTILRGSNTAAVLVGTDKWNLAADGQVLSTDHGASVVANLSASAVGTLVVEVSKRSLASNTQLITS